MASFFTTSSISTLHQNNDSNFNDTQKNVKIGIIGAGAAGLVAARVLSRTLPLLDKNEFDNVNITVLEKGSDIAGVWNYNQKSNNKNFNKKNKPMYRNLRTNLPKEIMAFREYPWPSLKHDDDNQDRSYVSHFDVYEYLQQYCEQYNLRQYIQLNCNVQQLTCLPNTKSIFSPDNTEEIWPQIRLEWCNTSTPNAFSVNDDIATDSSKNTKEIFQSDTFDAVFVCNGHYNVPSYPFIPGLKEYFQGTIMHSIEYDTPVPFVGQTVLCIGGRASGSDIAREIAQSNKNTLAYLSDTTFVGDQPITENNVTWLPKTIRILQDGRVQFATSDNTNCNIIEPIFVDTIILCTGYEYHFPFINDQSNIQQFNSNDRRVQLLYEQLWYATTPNIAFIGIPHSIIPFPLFEFQCEAVVQSWFRANGKSKTGNNKQVLPNLQERFKNSLVDATSGGYGKVNGRVPQDTHYLGSAQWEYCRRMAIYAALFDDNIEQYITTNKVRQMYSW
jgi:thioredoxin reductase